MIYNWQNSWPDLFLSFYDSLRRQVVAINKLSDAGMYFWDYGNAFLHQASLAGMIIICGV